MLTVTTGQRRLETLKQATEEAGGKRLFWFALLSDLMVETVLSSPTWQIAGEAGRFLLIEPL